MGRKFSLAFVGLLALLLAAACGSSGGSSAQAGGSGSGGSGGSGGSSSGLSGQLVVFAAASLDGAFGKIGNQFEQAHHGVNVKFSFAGSSAIATQIKKGTKADVFASADPTNMDVVTSDQLNKGAPETFAKNKLEIAAEAGNPDHISSVKDLSHKSVKVAEPARN